MSWKWWPIEKTPFWGEPHGTDRGRFVFDWAWWKLAVRNSSGQGEEWGHPCGKNPINGNLAVSQGLTTALNGACFQKSHGAVDWRTSKSVYHSLTVTLAWNHSRSIVRQWTSRDITAHSRVACLHVVMHLRRLQALSFLEGHSFSPEGDVLVVFRAGAPVATITWTLENSCLLY